MNNKTVNISVIACLLVSAQFYQVSASHKADSTTKNPTLQVYLPREVIIKNDTPNLGQVSIIRGRESLVAKASKIALGRISVPGQEIIINRPMVLSRLACNGIPASQVKLTGAEKTTVKQPQQIIKGSEFVEIASCFLGENLPRTSVRQWESVRTPKDLVMPWTSKKARLSPCLAKSSAKNHAKVQIAVFADDKEIGLRQVTFRLKYNCRRAITLAEIPRGATLSPENVKIEETLSNCPEPVDWTAPYGLVAKRRLPASTVVRPNMAGLAQPQILLGRNKTVIIRVEKAGLLVTAIGKTMQKGCAGEYIKVRNIDSQRIIVAKVNEDGTVEPVF